MLCYCPFCWVYTSHLSRASPLQALHQERAGPAVEDPSQAALITSEQGPSGSGNHGPPSMPKHSTESASGTGPQAGGDDGGQSLKVKMEEGDIKAHHELLIDVAEDMHHAHGVPCDRKQIRVLLYAEGVDIMKVNPKTVCCIVTICWPRSGREGAPCIPSKCHSSRSLRRLASCNEPGTSPRCGGSKQSSCSLPDATTCFGAWL